MGRFQAVGTAVVDGSGRDPIDVDVGIEDRHITRLGASGAHGEHLDAEGLTMTTGPLENPNLVAGPADAIHVVQAGCAVKDLR